MPSLTWSVLCCYLDCTTDATSSFKTWMFEHYKYCVLFALLCNTTLQKSLSTFLIATFDLLYSFKIALQARRWLVFGFVHVSSGAFSWCRVWGALQAGALWGYEPLPPPLPGCLLLHVPQGSGVDAGHSPTTATGVLKKWSLAPTEGPERARIRMHQDFEVSEALSEHEASVAATARRNETAVKALERSSHASAAMSNGKEGRNIF